MSTLYSFYSFDLEKKKGKNNIMSYFSDKHKLGFISNNKPISKKRKIEGIINLIIYIIIKR